MKLYVSVTFDVVTRPGQAALEQVFGSPAFLEWNKDLSRFLAAELAMPVNFDTAEVGWSTPVAFPIEVAADPETA
jgi:hypothetical protein